MAESAGEVGIVRVKAIAIVKRSDGALLVGEGIDPHDGRVFQRPLGGSVEFGETALMAVQREMVEEVGCELVGPVLLSVLENLFTFDGRQGHEVLFVFEGALVDTGLYRREEIECLDETERALGGRIVWPDPDEEGPDIVPTALTTLLRDSAAR